MSQFEQVSVEETANGFVRGVERLPVPGGFVYVITVAGPGQLSTTSCFVPEPESESEPGLNVEQAIAALTKAFQKDPDFARAWHDNIAMSLYDAGSDHLTANAGAARFMKLAFDTDTSR